jgi:hypothetical protein
MKFPAVKDLKKVGTYEARSKSGGGYFYDDVLEYRVWVHPLEGDDYYYAFPNYEEALEFSKDTQNAEEPLVLVYQQECIDEPEEGSYVHIKEPRITEWKPEWLENARGTKNQIPQFLKQKSGK